jgi:hypothetical protein
MHFLGPIRGVLPLGPNGVTTLNTLESSPLDANAAAMISYNYTLNQQGFASNITCIYDDQSPIRFTAVPENANINILAYNASCPDLGLATALTDVPDYVTLNTNNTLTFWACKSVPTDGKEPTYDVYLRGRVNYASSIGNITCGVSSIQAAIFPVEYQSVPSIFSSEDTNTTFANATPVLIEYAMRGLGAVISEGQNLKSNSVAESVITFGVKDFQLQPYERNETYLRLYEEMIKGILEYEVCLVN